MALADVPMTSAASLATANTQMQQDGNKDMGGDKNNIPLSTLQAKITADIRKNDAEKILTGVSIRDLSREKTLVTNNDTRAQSADSINTLPLTMLIMDDLRSGKINLNTKVDWSKDDRREGEGTFDKSNSPTEGTVKDLLKDMLKRSGNTSVRVIVNKVLGGPVKVNQRLDAAGLRSTRLDPTDIDKFYLGTTTPRETLTVMSKMFKKKDSYTKVVASYLHDNVYDDYGVKQQYAGNDYIYLANKLGQIDDTTGNNRHDVGVIYNTKTNKAYGYAFLTTSPSENTTATSRAEASLKSMGRTTLEYAGDKVEGNKKPHYHGHNNHKKENQRGKMLY